MQTRTQSSGNGPRNGKGDSTKAAGHTMEEEAEAECTGYCGESVIHGDDINRTQSVICFSTVTVDWDNACYELELYK